LDIDLVHEIKQKLLEPLRAFCRTIPFDINTMVLQETTKGKWKEVQVNQQRPLVYFGDRFLKPSKKKSDPTPIFNAGPPQMFGLVFPKNVWDNIQAQGQVRKITFKLHSMKFFDINLQGLRQPEIS
jgi:hypothetical protein